ncbi:MAG: delta-60 repeat domain-containing protein [Actinomycetota bacterium]
MRKNLRCSSVRLVAASLAIGTLLIGAIMPAGAVNIGHTSIVSETPASGTPNVRDGRVNALLVLGTRVYVGGTFSTVRNPGSSTDITRRFIFAFNTANGTVDTTFRPNLTGAVEAIAPGPDGSIFVGGKFNQTNGQGAPYRRLVRLNGATGATVTSFRANPDDQVLDLDVRNGQLYVGGEFFTIGGAARSGMARLDMASGTADPTFHVSFTDPYTPPPFPGRDPATPVLRVWKFDITPDNSTLVATGNFRQVDGEPREQIAILDLRVNPVAVTPWSTDFFRQTDPNVADQNSLQAAWCIPAFAHYIRGVDISPDGSYFATVTTGANWLHPSCDSMTRFDLGDYTANQQPEWVTQTGGDSFHSVLVTGAAIYGGGHQQFVNNPYNPNRCGFCTNPFPGGVARTGFSAHDPRNGMPFTWNPVRKPRGKGVLAMMSTEAGFYFGSDTDRIHGLTRQKLAFMPLTGGVTQAPENPYTLPGNFYTVGQTGSPDALLRRSFDGTTFVQPATDLGTGWSDVHGAFALNGRLYTGQSNGTLTVRNFNGTTAGSASTINLYGLENAPGPQYLIPGTSDPIPGLATTIPSLTGIAIDKGFIYYSVQGDPRLYARAFTQQSQILGAPLLVASTGDGVDWTQVRGMTIASGTMYFALSDGTLNAIAWNGGAYGQGRPTGSATAIGGPLIDGVNWASNAFFVMS